MKRPVTDGLARQIDAQQFDGRQVGQRHQAGYRRAQNPAVNPRGQVKALGSGQKRARLDQAAIGIAHAQQQLGVQPARHAVELLDALRIQLEPVLVNGLLQP